MKTTTRGAGSAAGRAARQVPFAKLVGTGNDFILVDARRASSRATASAWAALAPAMCDRRYGIGADGLLALEPSRKADTRMRIFNADGSEAEMCGNGARCVAYYVRAVSASGRRGSPAGRVTLETIAGLYRATVEGASVSMQMVDPSAIQLDRSVTLNGRAIRLASVNTGVPHVIVSVAGLDGIDVEQLGRALRRHEAFAPKGTNVNFIEEDVSAGDRLRIRTYERGVEAETLACGTGVTAAAVVHALRRHRSGANGHGAATSTVRVQVRSGETLTVRLALRRDASGALRPADVVLQGAVRWICTGTFRWDGPAGRWPATPPAVERQR